MTGEQGAADEPGEGMTGEQGAVDEPGEGLKKEENGSKIRKSVFLQAEILSFRAEN